MQLGLHKDKVDAVHRMLDHFEDYDRLYRRVVVTTSAGTAFAYEWLGPTEELASLADGWPPAPAS